MKIVQPSFQKIFFIYVPFALIGILLSFFFTNAIVFILNWFSLFMLLIALISILTPFTKQKPLLHSNILKNKTAYWFGKLLLLQLAVILLFISFSQAVFQFILSNYTNQTTTALLQQTFNFYQGGLWPWPFILLVSCAIAYLGRADKYPALLRRAVQPVIKSHAEGIIGFGIEIFLKQGLLFSALLTIGILTLQVAHIICQWLQLPSLLSFSIPSSIVGILFLLLVAKNKWIQILTRKIWRQHYADNKLILIFCFISIFLLIAFNVVIYFIAAYLIPAHNTKASLLVTNHYFNSNQWLLLSFIWWLGIIPLLTKEIASIARERSLREILSAGLLLPILLGIIWHVINYYLPNTFLIAVSHLAMSWPVAFLSGIIGLLLTIGLFQNPHNCAITSDLKPCNSSVQSTITFLRTLWQLCTYILAAYLLTNLTFLTILGAALTAPIIATLFSSILGALITAISSHKNTK